MKLLSKHIITIHLLFLTCWPFLSSHAQSISHLVRWNSVKNTELVARDIHKSDEKILKIQKLKNKLSINKFKSYMSRITNLNQMKYIFNESKTDLIQARQGVKTLFKITMIMI